MQELENRIEKRILEILKNREKVNFTPLLEECRKIQPTLSKVTLTKYLKKLLVKHEIEKLFDVEHFKGYYKIANNGIAKLIIEPMIDNLGKTAVYYILKKKLNKPIDVNSDILNEINQYIQSKEWTIISNKALYKYLKENYLLEI